jgi:cytoskeletal protein CcmA (bactofilin family)
MLLSAQSKKSEALRTQTERGSALLIVVGVMALGLLISALIASSLTATFTYSSTAKAGIQAQTAAESGVASALAGLNTVGSCDAVGGVYQDTTNPRYRATTWRSVDGATWVRACPDLTTTQVRIISTGFAQGSGVGSATSENQRIVEATYSYGAGSSGGSTPGNAMYVYSAGNLDTYHINSLGVLASDVAVTTGNFSCTGPTVIQGTVLVGQGSANLTNDCTIYNSVLATGAVTLTSNSQIRGDATSTGAGVTLSNVTDTIGGNVYANGAVSTNGNISGSVSAVGAVTLVQGSSVGGSIAAGAQVSISGSVGGSVTTPGNMSFVSTGSVVGSVRIGGTLTYGKLTNSAAAAALISQGKVSGTISYGQTGIATPSPKSAPILPGWIDLSYSFATWQANGFATQLIWPSNIGCRLGDASSTSPSGALYPWYQQLKGLTSPTVIDARSCSSVSGSMSVNFKTDVAFIGTNFGFDSLTLASGDSQAHKVWFIVPDAQPSVAGPQCTKHGGNFTVSTTSSVSTQIDAFVYAPCSIAINNGTTWTGQLYSGDMVGGGGTRVLNYVPIGIPGTTIGGSPLPPTPGQVGSLIFERNRSDNGE